MIKALMNKKRTLTMFVMMTLAMVFAASAGAAPLDFSTTTVEMDVQDVVGSGLSFMGIFNDYVLLGLGIVFAGIIVGFIFWLIGKAKKAAPGNK